MGAGCHMARDGGCLYQRRWRSLSLALCVCVCVCVWMSDESDPTLRHWEIVGVGTSCWCNAFVSTSSADYVFKTCLSVNFRELCDLGDRHARAPGVSHARGARPVQLLYDHQDALPRSIFMIDSRLAVSSHAGQS